MGLFSKTKPRVAVLKAPKVGILNLMGSRAADLVQEDLQFLRPTFGDITATDGQIPKCDVLFLYCEIQADGHIQGTSRSLREIIRDAEALVVVVASPNQGSAYVQAGKVEGVARANLVMTLDRKGAAFSTFFTALFAAMRRGVSMPVAWARLAPQGPVPPSNPVPECIFACEAGQLAFA